MNILSIYIIAGRWTLDHMDSGVHRSMETLYAMSSTLGKYCDTDKSHKKASLNTSEFSKGNLAMKICSNIPEPCRPVCGLLSVIVGMFMLISCLFLCLLIICIDADDEDSVKKKLVEQIKKDKKKYGTDIPEHAIKFLDDSIREISNMKSKIASLRKI